MNRISGIHAHTHTRAHVEGGDNRDANDGSSNNVMHFRSVLKLYKILPSTRVGSFGKRELLLCSIVNAALSIREERVAISVSPHYPPLPVYPEVVRGFTNRVAV